MNNQENSNIFIDLEEKKHYDVGIVGWWYNLNYGGALTYFALHQTLKNMGLSVLMIEKMSFEKNYVPDYNQIPRRFAKKHYDICRNYAASELKKLNNYCDTFISGSDQLFNPSLWRWSGDEYFLGFVAPDKKMISYASSFGEPFSNTNGWADEWKTRVTPYLKRFDAISVREDYAVGIVKNVFGLKAKKVLEPVLLCDTKEWDALIKQSTQRYIQDYFVSFLLDPCKAKKDAILYIEGRLKLSYINLINATDFEKNIQRLDLDNVKPDLDIEDFLWYYKNSKFVITDSFHGTCFAIIFRKPFIAIANKERGQNRFISLLRELDLMNRLIFEYDEIYSREDLLEDINWEEVYKKLGKLKQNSYDWLKTVIFEAKAKLPDINLQNTINSVLKESMCTGCSACVNSCPAGAISLCPDKHGYYRAEVDYEKCIGCGKCMKACPAIKLPQNNNFREPELYEFIAEDNELLYRSSSGGAFPLLAKQTFKRGGVVVGAAWREDFSVEHIMIDKEEDLHRLQKSKYLQSYMGDAFKDIKEALEKNTFVLFSGCPCQVAGLKIFLEKDYENLIMVDLLCGNAPSTAFFQKYIKDDFNEPLAKYEFRHKVQGWNPDCTTTTTTTGNVIVRRGGKQDSYQRVYHNHVMCPEHCEKCIYQNAPRFGDITIGDFWGVSDKDKTIDVRRGISAVLCNNEKGRKFFHSIPEELVSLKKKVPLAWLGGNGFVNGGHNSASPKRDAFYKAIETMSFSEAINYALKSNHGIYGEKGLFNYSAKTAHFSFDATVWEEHYINGITVLITKQLHEKTGKYLTMPLGKMLEEGKNYILKMRFKVKSDADIINFHVKDSGTRLFQVIYSHKICHADSNWVEIRKEFIPDSNIYDEFMIGAAQLCGEGRFLAIDYIDIMEC